MKPTEIPTDSISIAPMAIIIVAMVTVPPLTAWSLAWGILKFAALVL